MKKLLALLVLMCMGLTSVGCSTPAYSGRERMQMIGRNISFEGGQIQDDIDSLLLLRPASRMTIWNIR
jgi:hypothetical protein